MDRLQEEMEQWLTLHIDSDKVAAEIRHGCVDHHVAQAEKKPRLDESWVKAVLVTHNLQAPQSWLSCAHFQALSEIPVAPRVLGTAVALLTGASLRLSSEGARTRRRLC